LRADGETEKRVGGKRGAREEEGGGGEERSKPKKPKKKKPRMPKGYGPFKLRLPSSRKVYCDGTVTVMVL
jgi:hypothetical protein